jgi:hypothetical protein
MNADEEDNFFLLFYPRASAFIRGQFLLWDFSELDRQPCLTSNRPRLLYNAGDAGFYCCQSEQGGRAAGAQ